MTGKFIEWATNAGWNIERADKAVAIPEQVASRYKNIPEDWLNFIQDFNFISNGTEDIWFLTCYDYLDTCHDFEEISLEAAEGDEGWTEEIKTFWDNTMPIVMSVGGDYHYFGINLETGKVVEGWEPEFEDPTEVADSFNSFIEKIISGEIFLV